MSEDKASTPGLSLWSRWIAWWAALIANGEIDFFPIRRHLTHYNRVKALADTRAGVNVALLAFPQAMAYSMIAGLPLQYGVYCAAVAPIVAALFASSRLTMVGPSNATAVMVMSVYMGQEGYDRVASLSLLVFMVGVFLIIGSFLKFATLTQYVSRSVVIGYITAAAFLIVANQAHHVLGYSIYDEFGDTSTFFSVVVATVRKLGNTDGITLALTLFTLLVYFYISRKYPHLPQVAVTLVVCAFVGTALMGVKSIDLETVQPIPFGSWHITPPTMSFAWFRQLASGAAALAFLAALENTFMAKTLANRTGEALDVNQEMFALGVANVASGFFSGMPASGSPSRSSLNWSSGAMTPVAAIISGVICLVAAPTIGFLVKFVPLSSLAVVVIITAFGLIDFQTIQFSLRATKSDAAVLLTTFVAALLVPLDFAIFLGVGISIVLFLRKASVPQLAEYTFNESGELAELREGGYRQDSHISIIHVEGELFFGAADLFRDQIRRLCSDTNLRVIILRLKNARHLDATSVMALAELIKYLRETDRHLIISGASLDVFRVLRNSGLLEILGKDNFFKAYTSNPNLSTRNALIRARQLIGQEHAEVRIFFDQSQEQKKTKGG
jgi:sulfate permease, SulP family